MSIPSKGLTITGAFVSAVAASACCLGPLVLTVLGIGGAASVMALEPYRPHMLALTTILLGSAFYMTYRRPARDCAPGEICEMPRARRAGRVLLWVTTVLVLLAASFPWYSVYLF